MTDAELAELANTQQEKMVLKKTTTRWDGRRQRFVLSENGVDVALSYSGLEPWYAIPSATQQGDRLPAQEWYAENEANARLIAAAPDLAREVLALRKQVAALTRERDSLRTEANLAAGS
jgi:hypothetical protein